MDLPGDAALVPGGGVGAVGVEHPVAADEVRVVLGQPAHEPLAGAGPQVQGERRDGRRPGRRDGADGVAQLRGRVGQVGDDRGHQHAAGDAVCGERAHHVQAPLRRGRARLDRAPQGGVDETDGDGDPDVRDVGGLPQQVEVAQDQRALGEDGERVRVVAQGGDDARHQPVAALGALVAVDVRPHGDVLAAPAPRAQLAAEQVGGVHLDDDLRVESGARVEVQVAVRLAGEAVDAGVGAAAVRIHRPGERHARGAGHAVDDGAGPHLVEGDAAELGGVERPRDDVGTEQRGCRRRGVVAQVVPAHRTLLAAVVPK